MGTGGWGSGGQRSGGTEMGPGQAWRGAVATGPFWGRARGGGRAGQEGAAQAGERQRPPRRGRGRCVHVRDSVRTVPGPVPAGRACAVCLRPKAGVRVCSRASVARILPGACVRERERARACVWCLPARSQGGEDPGACVPRRECAPRNKRGIRNRSREVASSMVTREYGNSPSGCPLPTSLPPGPCCPWSFPGTWPCDCGVCPPPSQRLQPQGGAKYQRPHSAGLGGEMGGPPLASAP